MNNELVNPKPNRLKALAFLEVGLFEFFFVAVALFLIFGTLNYFNILPVSDVFPKYLSWLPRREVPSGTSRQTKTAPLSYTPVSSPTPQGQFQYDTKKAETLLTQYIKDNIKPEFLPNRLIINQGQQIDGVKSNTPYEFGWYQSGIASFGATLHFVENTNTIDDKEMLMEIDSGNLREPTLTASTANSLLSKYLITNEQIQATNCKTAPNVSSCQVFKQNETGKSGFGIVFLGKGAILTAQTPHLILFSCSLSKDGNTYKTQQSCLRGF